MWLKYLGDPLHVAFESNFNWRPMHFESKTMSIDNVQYTTYCIYCHLLFGIMQRSIYLLYISYFANKCQIGSLEFIEHLKLYLVIN